MKDLTNLRFNRLLVIERSDKAKYGYMWKCLCDCGNITYVLAANLLSNRVKSCGCLKEQRLLERSTTHNQRHTKLYEVWKTMKQRCGNPKNGSYHNYGGRGISVCDEWKNSFENFYQWSTNNGYTENLTLDRIDVNGDYSPENCRWANRQIQANNTRVNHLISYNGKTDTIANWARELGMNIHTLYCRLFVSKWSVEKAFTTPVKNV